MKYWIGDIIEFKHNQEDLHVDRIYSLHKLTHKDGTVQWEYYLELYPEMTGSHVITPEDVVRLVEKSEIPRRDFPKPELTFKNRVVYAEKERAYIDRIKAIEQVIGRDADRVQYILERAGYCMAMDEFDEVLES